MGLASRWIPWLVPDAGSFPEGRPTPATWWLTGLVMGGAGTGLTLWLLSQPGLGNTTVELVEIGQRTTAGALWPLWWLLWSSTR